MTRFVVCLVAAVATGMLADLASHPAREALGIVTVAFCVAALYYFSTSKETHHDENPDRT